MSFALGDGVIALLLSLVEPLDDELPLGMLELELPLGVLELDELLDGLLGDVDDGELVELLEDDGDGVDGEVVDGDVVVLDELDDGDGGVLSLRWQPARAPSIRTTPSAAQAFLFMKPPIGIENGSGDCAWVFSRIGAMPVGCKLLDRVARDGRKAAACGLAARSTAAERLAITRCNFQRTLVTFTEGLRAWPGNSP